MARLNLSLASFAARLDFVSFDIWIMPCFPMAAGFEAVHIPSFCATEGEPKLGDMQAGPMVE